jgi:hypothetical protein
MVETIEVMSTTRSKMHTSELITTAGKVVFVLCTFSRLSDIQKKLAPLLHCTEHITLST